MRTTADQEIIFEGSLEARVAAQLLSDAGRADLLETVEPPINPPSIGRLQFIAALGNEQKGFGDTTEYVCAAAKSIEVFKTLLETAQVIPPGQVTVSRKKYMGQKLVELVVSDTAADEKPEVSTMEIAGMTIVGVSAEQADVLLRRDTFVKQYLAKRGWTASELSLEQVLEIRRQPGWQNPPEPI